MVDANMCCTKCNKSFFIGSLSNPCINIIFVEDTMLYSIKCPQCGNETRESATVQEAVSLFNKGDTRSV